MAIISDVELLSGFNVVIRWFAKASQRYPANENDYYTTTFDTLAPNTSFSLSDPRFVLSNLNEVPADIEYVIRDICHTQTLVPQSVDRIFFNPDYRTFSTLSAPAGSGDSSIAILTPPDSNLQPGVNQVIQIGTFQSNTRMITAISGDGLTLTLDRPLTFSELQGAVVSDSNIVNSYPDTTAAATIQRILDNEGSLLTDPLEVTTPLFFDTSETIIKYYYTSALDRPFNGALGSGDQTNQTVEHPERSGIFVEAGWWAVGDADNTAADDALLIDSQGFVLDTRNMNHASTLFLSYGIAESTACGSLDTLVYYGNHPNFRGQVGPDPPEDPGTTSIINMDGTTPPAGYYGWISTLSGDLEQRFVKYWDGTSFPTGFVSQEETFAPCALALQNFITIHTYTSLDNLACGVSPNTFTVWFTGSDTFGTSVDAIFTDAFGPSSDEPSALGSSNLRVGGNGIGVIESGENNYVWSGSSLDLNTQVCLMTRFCGDSNALRVGTGQIRDDSLCEYANNICVDVNAGNYVAPADRLSTDTEFSLPSIHCTPRDTRTATYTVTTNLPRLGRTLTVVSDSGFDGDMYSISYELELDEGYVWVVEPGNLTGSASGTFSGSNIDLPIIISGALVAEVTAPSGCNVSEPIEAANYRAGSLGDETCYFGPFNVVVGSDGTSACDNFNAGATAAQVYQTTSTLSLGTGSVLYTDLDGTLSTASWVASDSSTAYNLTGGRVVGSETCPLPNRIQNLFVNQAPAAIVTNQEFAVRGDWSIAAGSFPSGFTYSWSGTGIGGDTDSQATSRTRTNPNLLIASSVGNIRLTLTVVDAGTDFIIGRSTHQIRVSTPSSRNPGGDAF